MIELISPKQNVNVCLVNEKCKLFYDAYKKQEAKIKNDYIFNGVNWGFKTDILVTNYTNQSNKYFEVPITFFFKIPSKSWLILASDNKFQCNVSRILLKEFETSKPVYNLLRNTKYYWKIVCIKTKEESEIRSFNVLDYPRGIFIDGIINIRDFGGYNTKYNKRIKQNLLFRGSELVTKTYIVGGDLGVNQQVQKHIKNCSQKTLNKLRKFIRNGVEIDLRNHDEANFIEKSFLTNKKYSVDYFEHWTGGYDYIFTGDHDNEKWFKQIFEIISNSDKKPVYVHCWGGADRTGTVCFLLGALLGMSYTDLVVEYELTSFCGNTRRHYDLNPPYDWMRFVQMVERLEDYGKQNGFNPLDIDKITEHFLINVFKVNKETIDKIKSIFLAD